MNTPQHLTRCAALAAAMLLPALALADAPAHLGTNAAPAKPAQRLTLECERDLVPTSRLIPSLAHLPPDARRFRKLEFARTPQGPLYLDLYLPAKPQGRIPLMVWIHGGGFHTHPTARDDYLPGRVVGRGYALASIDYRDSKVAPVPRPGAGLQSRHALAARPREAIWL